MQICEDFLPIPQVFETLFFSLFYVGGMPPTIVTRERYIVVCLSSNLCGRNLVWDWHVGESGGKMVGKKALFHMFCVFAKSQPPPPKNHPNTHFSLISSMTVVVAFYLHGWGDGKMRRGMGWKMPRAIHQQNFVQDLCLFCLYHAIRGEIVTV